GHCLQRIKTTPQGAAAERPFGRGPQRVAKAPRSRGNPFLPAYAGQKFLPPGIPLGTKLSAEPRTRRKAARTLSALNFPVCVPSIRTCRLDGTFLIVCDALYYKYTFRKKFFLPASCLCFVFSY